MNVLIVHGKAELGLLWQRHLHRCGMSVQVAESQDQAISDMNITAPDIIILDLMLQNGSALAVADYANYRCPATQVIFVTNNRFFSDGSIFSHVTNACAFIQSATPPEDLAAMVDYYAAAR
ncbi:response regulator [Aliishimia ponticola]|uniref:Response regulator n=1 Tax=Aliishimia ponticola TaxID=2499833 RepID=A0A4S4N7F8_9RHOB|nr:response regulator [Aliishimia ponticola]THH35074.1 response regulator [Aliishimia ponticola]